MEYDGVYDRVLSLQEKETLKAVVESAEKLKKHGSGRSCVTYFGQLNDKDRDFIHKLFSSVLWDYKGFRSIIFNGDRIVLQPEKKWSSMFTGVSPILLDDLMNDSMYLYDKIDFEILNNHIIDRPLRPITATFKK